MIIQASSQQKQHKHLVNRWQMGEECIIMFWGVLISSQTGNIDSYRHFEVPLTLYE